MNWEIIPILIKIVIKCLMLNSPKTSWMGKKFANNLVKEFDKDYNYFRHPFLHVGLDKAKHDSLRLFLEAHDYTEAPVSIDNDDYIFAYAYNKAMLDKDESLMKKNCSDYVD